MRVFFAILITAFLALSSVAQNETAPLTEKTFDYKDWVYRNVETGKDVNLRKFTHGKKLVMVVYWAPWCPNWKYDAAYVQGLYEKYKGDGFDIIGVGEYDSVDKMKAHIKEYKLAYTNVYESTSSGDREKTVHFAQRREAGDVRKWGSPWYVFLEPSAMEPEGQIVLSKKPMVVNGELKRDDIEKYIRQRLGANSAASGHSSVRMKEIEICEPDKKISLTKP